MSKISLIIFTLAIIITPSSPSSSTVDSESDGGIGQWRILTKQNFSSQIRLHPHILLVVSVPCKLPSLSVSLKQYSLMFRHGHKIQYVLFISFILLYMDPFVVFFFFWIFMSFSSRSFMFFSLEFAVCMVL